MLVSLILNELLYTDSSSVTRSEMKFMNTTCSDDMAGHCYTLTVCVCMCIRVCVHTCVRAYVCACMCVCVCVSVYLCNNNM